ncbi:hypothetical protein BGW80DRAFT_1458224 [Lactifluus volemus]|nr:hypothetical protein BGW80DRAFT_1458224 [Lactifluus volemus]
MTSKKKKDREREDIERSWDVPVPGNVVNNAGPGQLTCLALPRTHRVAHSSKPIKPNKLKSKSKAKAKAFTNAKAA